jgi:diguanylate cyclase (GGDEF)-like protein/excisionase family DNA binding protein
MSATDTTALATEALRVARNGGTDADALESIARLVADAVSSRGDLLTGLPSRGAVEARLAVTTETPSVLLLDLDRFQDVNAALGHRAGDELLVEVVRRIRAALAPGDILARVGGDSFAVAPAGPGGERAALRCADALEAALAEPFDIAGHTTFIAASFGIAVGGEHAPTPEAILADAGDALRRAKASGGRRRVVFDPLQGRRRAERVTLEAELRRALQEGEFGLAYQPIVSLHDGSIAEMEALLRWNHPRRGVLSPGEFLAVAEESGLIADIGRWALRQACRQAAHWADEPGLTPVTVAVNVSGRQLAEPNFADEVRAVLEATGVPPERLLIELTETILMEHAAAPAATVQRLREVGVRVALDDFGTGYSSLGSLRSFPIQTLKVDRLFVAEMLDDESESCVQILRAIVEMARAMDLEIVAEGIETHEQLRRVAALGCTSAQGFLLSRPVPAAAAELLLRNGLSPELVAAVRRAAAAGQGSEPSQLAAVRGDAPALTLSQACDALGVSMSTLRRWADAGRIRVVRTAGGHRRFPASEIRRLNRARNGSRAGTVRPIAPPSGAAPTAADMLRSRGGEMIAMATGALYRGGRPGWFSSEPAVPNLRAWLAALTVACVEGEYPRVGQATDRLLAAGALAGATVLERDGFLERVFELLVRSMSAAGARREESLAVQRLGRSLRQRGLALADAA